MLYSHPVPIDQVASDFPIAHPDSAQRMALVREAIAVAMRHRQVYLELSLFYDFPGWRISSRPPTDRP
jgi:hypothetical protein